LTSETEKQTEQADEVKKEETSRLLKENELLKSQLNELRSKISTKAAEHEKTINTLSENMEKETSQFLLRLVNAELIVPELPKLNLKSTPIEHKAQNFKNYLNQVNIISRERIITEAFAEVLTEHGVMIHQNTQLKDIRAILKGKLAQKAVFEERKVNIEADNIQKPNKPTIINKTEQVQSINNTETKGKINILSPEVIKTGVESVITIKKNEKRKPVLLQESGSNDVPATNANQPDKKKEINFL